MSAGETGSNAEIQQSLNLTAAIVTPPPEPPVSPVIQFRSAAASVHSSLPDVCVFSAGRVHSCGSTQEPARSAVGGRRFHQPGGSVRLD